MPKTTESYPTSNLQQQKKREKNKRKKIKYKLRLKERKAKPKSNRFTYTRHTNIKSWKHSLKLNRKLNAMQELSLMKIHNLSTIKDRNNSLITNIRSTINIETYRKSGTNITTTIKSTSAEKIHTLEENIFKLEQDNIIIQQKIQTLKKNTESTSTSRINNISKVSTSKGYSIKTRLLSIKTNLYLFHNYLNNRLTLSNTVIANNLKQESTTKRQLKFIQEQINLSTNKIHNFTSTHLPQDTIDLLNKGTNFIPTPSNLDPTHLYDRISTEVNDALIKLINKPHGQSFISTNNKQTHYKSKKNITYTKKSPTTLLKEEQSKPNFNYNLIEYIHNTSAYTKQYLQNTDLNDITHSHLINVSSSTLQHITELENNPDIIVTQTDKNMGWALVPTTWFTNEYK
jgi:hypothetical protein